MKLINKTKNTIIAEDVIVADSIVKRMVGLLGRKGLFPKQAMILRPCNSIHTFFMSFPIDVIFLNKFNVVVKVISSIKPFRMSGIYFGASYAIEFPALSIIPSLVSKGDTILPEA